MWIGGGACLAEAGHPAALTQRGGGADQEFKANKRNLDGAQGLQPARLHSATESGPESKRSLKREERLGMGKEREGKLKMR